MEWDNGVRGIYKSVVNRSKSESMGFMVQVGVRGLEEDF